MLEEQVLDSKFHNRSDFDCGTSALNNYLQKQASQDQRRGVSNVYVLVDDSDPQRILAYYTLSAAQIECTDLQVADRTGLPRYPVPAIRMGRLAVDQREQGNGLGKHIIGCAVDRCLKAKNDVAVRVLVVDAKDDEAISFYEKYGFVRFSDRPSSLYLSLGQVR